MSKATDLTIARRRLQVGLRNKRPNQTLFLAVWMFLSALFLTATGYAGTVQRLAIGYAWAGHPVGFCLLTEPPNQYVAYYGPGRVMMVAARRLGESQWEYAPLPEQVGWDSHNYVTMAMDAQGYLHLSGNMHGHPLKYFRTAKRGDITTFQRIPAMLGSLEERVTYPQFLRGPAHELIFTYRDGQSGAGNQIYNVYAPDSQTWRRLLDTPLIDGEGERNAYLHGPLRGPDGYYHLCWVWRDTPDCATNHSLSYARSRDLQHWETSAGRPLRLPITFGSCEIVDPTPPGGGVINGLVTLGFDAENRPVISYHKYDPGGNSQVFNARRETKGWRIYQSTDWTYRWEFGGGGAIEFEVHFSPIYVENGSIIQFAGHTGRPAERWRLNPANLKPAEKLPPPQPEFPPELRIPQSSFPGMRVHLQPDIGVAETSSRRYYLRWETLGPNRDRPRQPPWPPPTPLELIVVDDATHAASAS